MSIRWTVILGISLALIIFFVPQLVVPKGAEPSLVETVILIFLAEMLLGIFSVDRLLRQRPPQRVEHLEGQANIIKRGWQMMREADHSIHCIWCAVDYNEELIKYFERFRNLKPTVHRLINVKKYRTDVVKHLKSFINEIREGKYIVTSTTHEAFEFLVTDKATEVELLIPHPTKYGISEGIYSSDSDIAHAIYRMYEDLKAIGDTLVIPPEASNAEAEGIINEWVENNCS